MWVPVGANRSTIAYRLAAVGAIVAPASRITAAIASTLPLANISAPWTTASVVSSRITPPERRAPPPSRVAAMPPNRDPRPQSPSSGPAAAVLPSAFDAAVTPTSVAPNTAPVAISTSASVRIAGERSEPPRRRGASGSGRQARDAGCAANASVAANITMPADASAAPVDQIAPTPSASGGPSTNVTSSTVDSNANSAGSRLGSVTIPGSSVRTQADSGGVATPAAAASATSTAGGVLAGASPVATSMRAVTVAPATSTAVWPQRSTSRPSSGAAAAAAIA